MFHKLFTIGLEVNNTCILFYYALKVKYKNILGEVPGKLKTCNFFKFPVLHNLPTREATAGEN